MMGRRIAASLCLAAPLLAAAHPGRVIAAEPVPSLSLLALGDTGKRHRFLARFTEGQLAVARGMVSEDARDPVDGIVFLGDNFYMEGLRSDELDERIRENLVRPYCHFLDLTGPLSPSVESDCTVPRAARRPIPLYAVFGNHDLISPESPRLQREAIPARIANWHAIEALAEVHELGFGVSLILLDSEAQSVRSSPEALASALSASEGPLRIVAAHRPAALTDEGAVAPATSYYAAIREAVAQTDRPIHLFLSGHHHSLQLLELDAPAPRLNAIAGSGSRWRDIEGHHPGRRFGAAELGFARVDLVGEDDSRRLVVSLYETPLLGWGPAATLVARWSVGLDGSTRDELAEPE